MHYFKKISFFVAVFLIAINKSFSYDSDLSGQWCWDKDSDVSAFSIELHRAINVYHGGYSSVALSGDKIDDNVNAFAFKTSKNNMIKTIFTAGITGNKGIIQLKIIGEKKMEWLVLLYPSGEIYVPRKATLYKCK